MNETKKSNTEQLILEAAEQEFLVKGYDGARTTIIAEKAGVTHAMLHYYFRTKEQLFERIVAKNSAVVAQTMIAAMGDPNMPVQERIKSGVASHFDLIVANPQLPRFLLNEIILRPERYHMLYENWQETIGQLFEDLQNEVDQAASQGEIEPIDVHMLFLSIISLNVFPFVAQSFAEPLMGNLITDREKFLAARKAENIETILRRIKKQSI